MERIVERIASETKIAEWKQSILSKTHEQLHSEASSFLIFSLQWKDLERHFESTREMILTLYEEVERRETAISSKEEAIALKEEEFELKKKELNEFNLLIEKSDAALKKRKWS
ncbi:FRIGIDA-like protein 5 isoform X1 [Cucumis melo var. makuwa]|uniref:FRIGIDA-like protein 5 isoform X1 n=2 Tax=Cucumis melo TaxID=3656 RepID=A0A5A7TRV6_CUCMM|nr:FRIGIDA-like protein 5 isoform X1 [Cucumis melo var. makuwa]